MTSSSSASPASPRPPSPASPPASPARPRPRVAAFFDLDKTVIATSSALAFSKPFFDGGLLTRRAVLRSAIAQLQILLTSTEANQVELLRKHVTDMCAGWDAAQVRQIVSETLEQVVRPTIFTEAADLISRHRAAGHDIVLVSASGLEMVEPIGALLGVDFVRASIMHVEDGHYSGELDFYCYGEQKAVAMRALADEHGYDLRECFAYSDSSTDLPMLNAVGHPSVVNPNRHLRRYAQEMGWPIMEFPKPVAAPTRPPRPTLTRTALCAIGIGILAASVIVYRLRHPKNPRSTARKKFPEKT